MKKTLKQYLIYLLTIVVTLFYCPFGVLAEPVNVGVNITGLLTIEYVATISSNMEIDLTNSNTGSTYLFVANHSNVYLKSKITDIEATSPGAPNQFVGPNEKNWNTLSVEDTARFISFEVVGTRYYHNSSSELVPLVEEGKTIYATESENYAEVDLGTLSSYYDMPGMTEDDIFNYAIPKYKKTYELYAKVGYNWLETKNITYSITIVTEIGGTVLEQLANPTDDGSKPIYDADVTIIPVNGAEPLVEVNLISNSDLLLRSELEAQTVDNSISRVYIEFYNFDLFASTETYELAFAAGIDASSLKPGAKIYNQINKVYLGESAGVSELNLLDGNIYYIPYTITVDASNDSINADRETYTINGIATYEHSELGS